MFGGVAANAMPLTRHLTWGSLRAAKARPRTRRLLLLVALGVGLGGAASAAGRSLVDPGRASDLLVWTDTCNVYVLRDGEAALLIDLGDGSLLDHLGEIGVKRVEWVLFTHHHRERCQGAPRRKSTGDQLGALEAESALFEQSTDFRKPNVRLGDAFTIHGSSHVRPLIQPAPPDQTFKTAPQHGDAPNLQGQAKRSWQASPMRT